ncbi:MAG: hypothetical protein N2C12_05090, partial [Planctomycetales bacterium]
QRGAVIDLGEYAMEDMDLIDLSLDYLLQRLAEYQRNEVNWIAGCAEKLDKDPPAQLVAKEALGAARGHLQSLEELVSNTSSAAG